MQKLDVQNSYLNPDTFWRHSDDVEGFSPRLQGSPEPAIPTLKARRHPSHFLNRNAFIPRQVDSRYRDLPCPTNGNVVRWKAQEPSALSPPQRIPLAEGYAGFYSKHEADNIEVREVPYLYHQVYEDPAIPVVKSEKEGFAGGLYTGSRPLIVESNPPPTASAKTFRSPRCPTSLGSLMMMLPGDNQGLVLPPHVASVQAAIVPCGITAKTSEEQRVNISNVYEELAQTLRKAGGKAKADLRDGYTPGYKFNDWEQKDVLLRLEIGRNDLAKKQTLHVRRDTGANHPVPLYYIGSSISSILATVQVNMFATAKKMISVDDLLNRAMKDKMDNDHSYGGEEEQVGLSNLETDDQPAFHSVHTAGSHTVPASGREGPAFGPSGGFTLPKYTIPPSLRILLQETSYLQHRLQDDLLDPAEFELPGTPPNAT
ncbi:hypothetical protein BKA70DRAFT_1526463 [Coprinopsis sp. MPI-PUGE-AT-0042]|nr:hypothetical protein BKA70DRAFT_1526463 [Coprinopsis sp. MPI-PUGE-AT-0042]